MCTFSYTSPFDFIRVDSPSGHPDPIGCFQRKSIATSALLKRNRLVPKLRARSYAKGEVSGHHTGPSRSIFWSRDAITLQRALRQALLDPLFLGRRWREHVAARAAIKNPVSSIRIEHLVERVAADDVIVRFAILGAFRYETTRLEHYLVGHFSLQVVTLAQGAWP